MIIIQQLQYYNQPFYIILLLPISNFYLKVIKPTMLKDLQPKGTHINQLILLLNSSDSIIYNNLMLFQVLLLFHNILLHYHTFLLIQIFLLIIVNNESYLVVKELIFLGLHNFLIHYTIQFIHQYHQRVYNGEQLLSIHIFLHNIFQVIYGRFKKLNHFPLLLILKLFSNLLIYFLNRQQDLFFKYS